MILPCLLHAADKAEYADEYCSFVPPPGWIKNPRASIWSPEVDKKVRILYYVLPAKGKTAAEFATKYIGDSAAVVKGLTETKRTEVKSDSGLAGVKCNVTSKDNANKDPHREGAYYFFEIAPGHIGIFDCSVAELKDVKRAEEASDETIKTLKLKVKAQEVKK
jgi:hypothetical protein